LHCEESGVADHLAYDENHALQLARMIALNLNSHTEFEENTKNMIEPVRPLYD